MELLAKYGGMSFWSDFLDQVFSKVFQDYLLRGYFESRDVNRIKEMMLKTLEMALMEGKLQENSLVGIHRGLNITNQAFERFVELYELTLQECDVEMEDVRVIIALLVRFKAQVVLEEGSR